MPVRSPICERLEATPARERILDTAGELFYRDGYGGAGRGALPALAV
jgi:hypothetical protein